MAENNDVVQLPIWLKEELFENVLRQHYEQFEKIICFKAIPGLNPGENYSTIMLRLLFEVELKDQSIEKVSYMLKTPHDFEMYREILKKNNMFVIERDIFLSVVPEIEQMYSEAGLDVKFAAKGYEIDAPDNYVLLEDLGPRGFKNADRLEGLDMAHTLSVLKKLAQWHAGSAARIALKGPYTQYYLQPKYGDSMREDIRPINVTFGNYLFKCLPLYEGYESYTAAVHKIQPKLIDLVHDMADPDPQDFNAINHGDLWTNNIMFRYDAESNAPSETYFVDLQLPKITSVAWDLIYFLLGSPQLQLKLNHFDYFIKYYHDQLIEHLTLLKYPTEKLPSLRFLHMQLHKYGFVGYHTVLVLCPPLLLDRTNDANLTDFVTETENGDDLKLRMYSNAKYKQHAGAILTWLHNRGALDF
ncbi:uncharacterized protein Dwil_GK11807 [Drosophila willistoni]|uniref:CHK kinase-like domain-containing protein n=1 Tax=Drosophila willistoni TaxID=7260 RepID=B4NAZ8_DROWI|nr:uncharacterized protein LOC6647980 [Drosophila willistoni]EDW80962.1 uncharacterized protein Dwil_GK11807 [Drosophila willistoni]